RHGNVRIYFQRRGQRRIRIREKPGTPEFVTIYQELLQKSEVGQLSRRVIGHNLPQPGTLRWLCVAYFASADFKQLDERTQRTRRGILEGCLQEPIAPGRQEVFADFPLSRLTPKGIRVLRDRKVG